MKQTEEYYEQLMSIKDSVDLDTDIAIQKLGILIDISHDLSRSEGLKYAIQQVEKLLSRELSDLQRSAIHYLAGNTWSNLRIVKHSDQKTVWGWEQSEIENELLHFRLFNKHYNGSKQSRLRFCQANTNLANTLSHIGRFVDAIEYWDTVLKLNPRFGMALANKGYGLVSYADLLYDKGHAGVFLKFAHRYLKQGLQTEGIHAPARRDFEQAAKNIEARMGKEFLEEPFDMDNYSLGAGDAERQYRQWCLNNHLFVNPLNDLGSYNIAAQDILSCPSIFVSKDRTSCYPPAYFRFFNQMKQEYVSARYLFYESLHNNKPHYSDRDVLLYNTLDYPCYGINIEKTKTAFRMAYSVFDKMAYCLNEYMNLGVPEKQITFKTIWYETQRKSNGVRRRFVALANWSLRGLFWLSKDLSEDRLEFREAIEPDGDSLAEIRNHLEHKYLTIHDFDTSDLSQSTSDSNGTHYSISRDDFNSKVLKLLKLVRAAVIYLSLGIHIEESKKQSKLDGGVVLPMPLDTWEDEWKV